MHQIIVQGIGYLALLFVLLSFQKSKRVNILLLMLVGLILFVIHYYLLNAGTGSLMNLVEAGVVFVSYKKETALWAKQKFWLYVFVLAYIIAGIVTFKSFVDCLPIIAQIFGAIAVWQTNPKIIRFLMLIPRPLWFAYNLVVGSYAGVTTEILILASVLIGIVRFDILSKHAKGATLGKKSVQG
ncbi:MAG TPA: YgjV family protein [Patescibacteria group bacterium]